MMAVYLGVKQEQLRAPKCNQHQQVVQYMRWTSSKIQ
jgi:hypothetical protein